ncbi:MAG: hypothetical protein HY078_17105 [Elusimicrobia bacterium]|nr:hypothetical protein [Elusimicrobiota bacterium]
MKRLNTLRLAVLLAAGAVPSFATSPAPPEPNRPGCIQVECRYGLIGRAENGGICVMRCPAGVQSDAAAFHPWHRVCLGEWREQPVLFFARRPFDGTADVAVEGIAADGCSIKSAPAQTPSQE